MSPTNFARLLEDVGPMLKLRRGDLIMCQHSQQVWRVLDNQAGNWWDMSFLVHGEGVGEEGEIVYSPGEADSTPYDVQFVRRGIQWYRVEYDVEDADIPMASHGGHNYGTEFRVCGPVNDPRPEPAPPDPSDPDVPEL